MTDNDWFDWQVRMLFERVERFAELLCFQLSVAETLLDDAQVWFLTTQGTSPPDAAQPKEFTSEPREFSLAPSAALPREVRVRGKDEIIAEAQKTLDLLYREAFAAGQRHVASELGLRTASLFEGLAEGHRQPSDDAAVRFQIHSSDYRHTED